MDNKLRWEGIGLGDVSACVEYTGTTLLNILKQEPEFDPEAAYEKTVRLLKENNHLIALDPIGFNNTYVFTVRKEVADQYGLKTATQLAEHSGELVFGSSQEFLNRPDAWPYVEEIYQPKFKEIKTIQEVSLQYKAAEQKLIDVFLPYSTDSKLLNDQLVTLEDDKHVFLPYDAFPIVREETLNEYPELEKTLNALADKIDEAVIQRLNLEVEQNRRPPLDVAKEWLKSEGFIQ